MKCPICGKSVKLSDSFSPFCSERCQVFDLANWAADAYVISTPIREEERKKDESSSE